MGLSGRKSKWVFADSGPTHLTRPGIEIDWDNEEHRRCITACLVKATYVLAKDRTTWREGKSNARAPAWWESFHFRRLPEYDLEFNCKCKHCKVDRRLFGGTGLRFIYGAVFQYAPPDGARRHPLAPTHIVAFRGTMTWDPTFFRDMGHNLKILLNRKSWLGHVRAEVAKLLLATGRKDTIWLAGHSLGASIALDVGRHMMTNAEINLPLPAFLFNPPHVSLAPVIGEEARTDVYAMGYRAKYFLGNNVLTGHRDRMEGLFEQLSTWVPNLYVHKKDLICKGFIDYFEQRERMKKRLQPGVATSAATLSFRDMGRSLLGMKRERPHLLPSAMLWENRSSCCCGPHDLQQWWQPQGPELVLSSKQYTWP